jgi:hypothetical protein
VEQKIKVSFPVYDAVFVDNLSPFWKSLLPHLQDRILRLSGRRNQQAAQKARDKLPISVASYTKTL